MTQLCDVHEHANGYILVAEDDSIVQLVLKKMLERAGYNADFVSDGIEAISALESKKYDLVVLDCMMPRMDGFATSRFIRNACSRAINPTIPIIAMTGLTAKDDQVRCLDAGMSIHVSKPVDSNLLIAAIEQCLGRIEESDSRQNEMPGKQILDDEFLDNIIDRFLSEVPQVVTELQQAVEKGETVKLQNIGHKLLGVTEILEASTLTAQSKALEQAGKAGDLILASKLALALMKELQKLITPLPE